MDATPGTSVLIATHNGAPTLPRVLEAFRRLNAPSAGWSLVVVDNSSTDATPDILREYLHSLPLEIVRTEGRGKNLALNLGLRHVTGDLVVLTDDDVLPEAEWLTALRSAADTHPSCDVFGGPISAVWPTNPPAWLLENINLGATFGVTPEREAGHVASCSVWGANMAVRRRVFEEGHRFNEGVGPAAGQYIMGSEVEFTGRLERAGYRACFVPQARVGHIIRPNQMTADWIVERAYRLGRHMYHQEKPLIHSGTPTWLGAPRWKYREWLKSSWLSWIGRLQRGTGAAIAARYEASLLRGYLDEARRCREKQS